MSGQKRYPANQWSDFVACEKDGKLCSFQQKDIPVTICFIWIFRYSPSVVDSTVFEALKSGDIKGANLKRWYNHLKSFPVEERKKFVLFLLDVAVCHKRFSSLQELILKSNRDT